MIRVNVDAASTGSTSFQLVERTRDGVRYVGLRFCFGLGGAGIGGAGRLTVWAFDLDQLQHLLEDAAAVARRGHDWVAPVEPAADL